MSKNNVRQRRMYRAQSASFLGSLDTSCSLDELTSIDWIALESLPHWCFLTAIDKQRVQLFCGAFFLAPMMECWIEGRRIQRVLELIGAEAYKDVLEHSQATRGGETVWSDTDTSPELSAGFVTDEQDTEQMLLAAGAAVMWGSVQHPVIRDLLVGQFDAVPDNLSATIAQPLYNQALALYDRSQGSQDNDVADSVPDPTLPATSSAALNTRGAQTDKPEPQP